VLRANLLRMTMCTATPADGPGSPAGDRDMTTAAQLRRMLLPPSPFVADGWTAEHHFVTTLSGIRRL
jgi:hypothetical protein